MCIYNYSSEGKDREFQLFMQGRYATLEIYLGTILLQQLCNEKNQNIIPKTVSCRQQQCITIWTAWI